MNVPAINARSKGIAHVLTFLLITGTALADQSDCAFWVWHRDTAITESEAAQLTHGHCDTLYWHVGMAAIKDDQWIGTGAWLAPENDPSLPAMRCVPVLRGMLAGVKHLPEDHTGLLQLMQRAMERWHASEVQLDFDCPDRLLADYARQLAACRAAIRPARLSITALAGWALLPAFHELQQSVDELLPMFYDLEPDKPADVARGQLLPLIAQADIKHHLDAWSRCITPWRAGLPCFARLSIFDADGRSRGHVREWSWDEPTFHASLRSLPVSGPGLALFAVTKDCTLHDVPLLTGQRIAARIVDPAEASACARLARAAGTKSICWFRLPTGSASSGGSLAQSLSLNNATPALRLVVGLESLTLENTGSSDLAPRLNVSSDEQRGWQLEVQHVDQQPVFREATPGEFAHVQGHTDPDAKPPHEAPTLTATRLTFWLGDLKAGASRRAGIFSLAPGTSPQSLCWRLRGESDTTPWQAITPPTP